MKLKLITKLLEEIESLRTPPELSSFHNVEVVIGSQIFYMESDVDILDEKVQRNIADAIIRVMKKCSLAKCGSRIEVKLWPRLTDK